MFQKLVQKSVLLSYFRQLSMFVLEDSSYSFWPVTIALKSNYLELRFRNYSVIDKIKNSSLFTTFVYRENLGQLYFTKIVFLRFAN